MLAQLAAHVPHVEPADIHVMDGDTGSRWGSALCEPPQ
jgi:hypothetical protein